MDDMDWVRTEPVVVDLVDLWLGHLWLGQIFLLGKAND